MATTVYPVVRLRPMTEPEFAPWRELSIQQHGAQVSRATGKDLGAVIDESRELLGKILSAGIATERMSFLVVTDESDRALGWLWLGPSPQDRDAGFVYDIIIDADVRGRGYGRAAMSAAEQFFLAQGFTRIALDVTGGNDVARGLYESMGYLPISTSMAKPIATST
jgi:ribosomal protein S18 acetylase RimI-like enzyme